MMGTAAIPRRGRHGMKVEEDGGRERLPAAEGDGDLLVAADRDGELPAAVAVVANGDGEQPTAATDGDGEQPATTNGDGEQPVAADEPQLLGTESLSGRCVRLGRGWARD